jgi:hypothetical protein
VLPTEVKGAPTKDAKLTNKGVLDENKDGMKRFDQ